MASRFLARAALLVGVLAAAGATAATPLASASDTRPGPTPLKAGQAVTDCVNCPEMVVVPAGEFDMGATAQEHRQQGVPDIFANREKPVHRVTIGRSFAMSRNEITRAQYAVFVAETHRPIAEDCIGYDREKDNWGRRSGSWQKPGFEQKDDEPVVCISWVDATEYAAWLAKKTGKRYRLPTEAEWEYAARAGTTTARYWGDSPQVVCENSNAMSTATFIALGSPESWQDKLVCTSREAWTMSVGSFESNAFGLNDLYGGVWEWVADCAHQNYDGAPVDGSSWDKSGCDSRIVRGGAFHSEFWLIRSATRGAGLNPEARPVASGIRVARDIN